MSEFSNVQLQASQDLSLYNSCECQTEKMASC